MWVDTAIRYALWFLLFIGLWIVVYPLFQPSLFRLKKRSVVLIKREVKTANALVKATERFLETTINVHSSFSVYTFYFLLSVVSIMSFVGLFSSGRSFIESFFWMLVSPGLIIGFLYLRLHGIELSFPTKAKKWLVNF